MNNLQLGKRNQLKVLREKDHGVYLEGGDIGSNAHGQTNMVPTSTGA